MKFLVALIISMLVVAHGEQAKRQTASAILKAAGPIISKLGVDKILNSALGAITGLLAGTSGTVPLEGTQLQLYYKVDRCTLHIGKRGFLHKVAHENCKAQVCEKTITKTCHDCTKDHQSDALKCALQAELAEIQKLSAAA